MRACDAFNILQKIDDTVDT